MTTRLIKLGTSWIQPSLVTSLEYDGAVVKINLDDGKWVRVAEPMDRVVLAINTEIDRAAAQLRLVVVS